MEWRSALELPTEFVLREVPAADLMILGGTRHPVLQDPYRNVDPGAVLLQAGRPVLLVPPGIARVGGQAHCGSLEEYPGGTPRNRGCAAVSAQAETVAIVEFCEQGEEASAQLRLEDVKQFLVRHGVEARPTNG